MIFFSRLVNNNESEYFYLHKEPEKEMPENYCAFLRLPISIRTQEHYEECKEARINSLNEEFRAKLGSQLGYLYSRVGTKDFESSDVIKLRKEYDKKSIIWLDKSKLKQLDELIEAWEADNTGKTLSNKDLQLLISGIKKKKDIVIDRMKEIILANNVINQLLTSEQITTKQLDKLISSIKSDSTLTSLLG